jgi:hypothetical protein
MWLSLVRAGVGAGDKTCDVEPALSIVVGSFSTTALEPRPEEAQQGKRVPASSLVSLQRPEHDDGDEGVPQHDGNRARERASLKQCDPCAHKNPPETPPEEEVGRFIPAPAPV